MGLGTQLLYWLNGLAMLLEESLTIAWCFMVIMLSGKLGWGNVVGIVTLEIIPPGLLPSEQHIDY
jgi:hypothetical protein